jgi:hypothetical protein
VCQKSTRDAIDSERQSRHDCAGPYARGTRFVAGIHDRSKQIGVTMRSRRVAGLLACTAAVAAAAYVFFPRGPERALTSVEQPRRVLATYASLPLQFEANAGQTDARVEFLSRGPGYTLFLSGREAVVSLRSSGVVRMQLRGARDADGTGEEQLPGTVNYLLGNDPSRWRTDVPTFERVRYESVYDGIDLVYYGNQQQLEYDFVVAPGADPDQIRLGFADSGALRLDDSGDLVLGTSGDEVRLRKPVLYQERDDERVAVQGRYALREGVVGFELGDYDRSRPLVIDPILVYSTYLGGTNHDTAHAIGVDGAGNAYVAGLTMSPDFPTLNPFQNALSAVDILHTDAFVTKINAAGTALLYSTYIGGNSRDIPGAIAVTSNGQAVLVGTTASTDFPLLNPLQGYGGGTYLTGGDAFILKLSATGNALSYSTYIGGTGGESAGGLVLDTTGAAYVAGSTDSPNFPVVNAVQTALGSLNAGVRDAFVFKLNPAGTALVYSTYLGGGDADTSGAIAIDAAGNAYVTGSTASDNFPMQGPVQGIKSPGGSDAFITKLHPSGSVLVYSTYLGGSSPQGAAGEHAKDSGTGIVVDSQGRATVVGSTGAGAQFPATAACFGPCGGNLDAFITRLSANGGAFEFSARIGGSNVEAASAVALDPLGRASFVGYTYSTDFPVANPLQGTNAGGAGVGDWFIARVDSGGALDFSTYLGGTEYEFATDIAIDSASNLYVTGYSNGSDFPLVGPIQVDRNVSSSAVVLKLSDAFVAVTRPNAAGERVYTGTPYVIEWDTTLDDATIDGFAVDISIDDGVSFTPIPGCTGLPTSARSCTWNNPGPLTAKGRIRVRAMFLGTTRHSDVSDARFSILAGAATITVTQPNTGVAWPAGSQQTIKWTHNLGAASWVRIEASHDGGASWELVEDSVKNATSSSGTFVWGVTGPATAQGRIRVTWLNGPASDTSDANFNVVAPFVTMTAPKTGTNWAYGTSQTVMWNTNLPQTERVTIRLSVDGGNTYPYTIAHNIEASKKKVDVITPTLAAATNQARVRVQWMDNLSVQAVSPVNFQVTQAFVTVTSPDSPAQTWTVGGTPNITWAQNLGILENVKLELSLDGGSSFPITLFPSLKSDGKEKVTVQPGWVTTQGRVRVTWLDNPAVTDTSNANFVIQ